MPQKSERDWMDISAKLMIPIVLAIGGALYTWHKDSVDEKQRQWERDSGYIKLLASDNEQERTMGLKIIEVLKKEGQFSPDLVSVVKAIRDGRPSDPATQAAQRLLAGTPDAAKPAEGSSAAPSSEAPAAPASAPAAARDVYVQIGHEEQRDRALQLEDALRKLGYRTPGIELVAHPTFHTYIRYFDSAGAAKAEQIRQAMTGLGFSPQVQDFTSPQTTGSTALEVWFGDKEPAQAGQSAP